MNKREHARWWLLMRLAADIHSVAAVLCPMTSRLACNAQRKGLTSSALCCFISMEVNPLLGTEEGVDLAGLLGGRMASAEGGSVLRGVRYGEGCPLSSRLGVWGSVVSSPSGAPAENGFWRILKATERSFLYLYDKIWGGGQFALASPSPNSGELVPLSPP